MQTINPARSRERCGEIVPPAHRTWLVFAPYASFEKLDNPSVVDHLNQTGKVDFETYRAKVMLAERAEQPKRIAKTRYT